MTTEDHPQNNDDNAHCPSSLREQDTVMVMEQIVASRTVRSEAAYQADQRLAEQLHKEQLEERIRQLQAQVQQQQQNETSTPNTNARDNEIRRSTTGCDFVGATTATSLEQQESLLLLNKIVASRIQTPEVQTPEQLLERLKEQERQSYHQEQQQEELQPQQIQIVQEEEQPQISNLASTAIRVGGTYNAPPGQGTNDVSTSTIGNSPPQRQQVFPGAVRVGGINGSGNNDDENDEDGSTTFNVEQTKIQRQQEDFQSPKDATCHVVEINNEESTDDDATNNKMNDNNKSRSGKTWIGVGVVLLAACMIIITFLVVGNNGDKTPKTTTPPPTLPPTSTSAVCPCTFDTDGWPITKCGSPHELLEVLQDGETGIGTCDGFGACALVGASAGMFANDLQASGCFVVHYRQGDLITPANVLPVRVIPTDAELQACLNRLATKCEK